MPTNVIMPVLGMVQDTGRIVRWLKNAGDPVRQGEPLLEIETDKAVQELEAPASGILSQILAQEGDEVPVTQVVATIFTPEEYRSAAIPAESHAVPAAHPAPARPDDSLPSKQPAASQVNMAEIPASGQAYGRILASPKARRLAREAHLDLAVLSGSGPGGAILAQDVEGAARGPAKAAQPFSLHYAAQAGRFLDWQAAVQKSTGSNITFTDLLVLILARSLRRHPEVNATWRDGRIILFDKINIGLAVLFGGKMLAPVIRNAGRLSLVEIAKERQRLESLAQSGALQAGDLSGETFTLLDFGRYRVDSADGELGSSRAGVLAVGRVTGQAILNLSVSFDHRAVDSLSAAAFLDTLAGMIEEPYLLLA